MAVLVPDQRRPAQEEAGADLYGRREAGQPPDAGHAGEERPIDPLGLQQVAGALALFMVHIAPLTR
jgi:hypothetical protein